MRLQELSLLGFKNIKEAKINFCSKINCLTGSNGMGKTNILDAIYYLAFTKSFFNTVDSQNITFDETFFMIQGSFESKKEAFQVLCALKKGQKKQVKKNQNDYERLADHIGLIPLVMSSPNDVELIYEGSEARRKFFDSIISQYDKIYLERLLAYNKVLSQRNALLKKGSSVSLEDFDIWDEQLILHGEGINQTRHAFLKEFIPLFNSYYAKLSNKAENVDVIYNATFQTGDFAKVLKENFSRDMRVQFTSCGIHRDDFAFLMNGYAIKRFSSQGQQKSFLLALRFAQFHFLRQHKNEFPILILDDIFDKLDELRFVQLLELISGDEFGQVFISDTQDERLRLALQKINSEVKYFKINNGQVNELAYA